MITALGRWLIFVLSACGLLGQGTGAHASPLPAKPPASSSSAKQWLPGIHYTILAPKQATAVAPGKVEVREFFQYTSPASRALQPHLQEWLKRKPEYVEYIRQPRVALPHMFLQARMYYALKKFGREDLHLSFFEWIFKPEHYKVYHGNYYHPDEKGYFDLNLAFVRSHGIDADAFAEAYHSPQREEDLFNADLEGRDRHIYGTSTIVINGRYSTSLQRLPDLKAGAMAPEDFERLFRLINHLITLERSKHLQDEEACAFIRLEH